MKSQYSMHHTDSSPSRMASAAIRGRIVRDFQTQLYRTCGARSIVLVAYQKEDGTPQVSMYIIHVLSVAGPDIDLSIVRDEWNADVGGGMDFNDFCPKWRSTVLWDTWKKYGRKCFEQGLTCFHQYLSLSHE